MGTAELITAYEACDRRAAWSRHWERHKLLPAEITRRAVVEALTTEHANRGQFAGDHVMTLCSDRGLDISDSNNKYRCAMNHAAIADIVTTAIKEPWTLSEGIVTDQAGTHLRRLVPVSTWNDNRQAYETRSWFSLGEVCQLNMPMQMVVAVLGPMNGGRRHGYWSKALLHPQRSSLRFRKRSRATIDGFKETWVPCWREENDQITREKWLDAMNLDGVLRESLFVVQIPVPEEMERQRIVELGKRQMDRIMQLEETPDFQLSTCDSPLGPCPFRIVCPTGHPEEFGGFDRLNG